MHHPVEIQTQKGELRQAVLNVCPFKLPIEHFKPLPRNNALAKSFNSINERDPGEPTRLSGFTGELREKDGLCLLLSAEAQVNKKQPAVLFIVGEDKQVFEDFQRSNPNAGRS